MLLLLLVVVSIGMVYWLVMAWAALRLTAMPVIGPAPEQRAQWPRLTVIVPACNEEEELEAAAITLLQQDYPHLQLVFVDDRSTDRTGAIIDSLAARDTRVEAVHIRQLPELWLGKVHALHSGLQRATGEIVLFTDADVHFADGALKAAVACFADRKLDQLAGFPHLIPAGLLLGAMLAAFLRQFMAVMRPWKVSDPGSKAFIGIGAFNLVRKEAFVAAGGFEWLRMEIGDDVGVGLMMKRAGRRCDAARITDWVSLYWHRTVASAVRGAEKGWSSICRFSIANTIIMGLVNTVLELSPLWALLALWPKLRWAGGVGAVTLGLYLFSAAVVARWLKRPVLPQLLSIFTAPIGCVVMIRTAILGHRRGGALWRGTHYSTQALREGMRLKFP